MFNIIYRLLAYCKGGTLISGRGSAIPSAKEGKSGSIYNMVKSGPRKSAYIS